MHREDHRRRDSTGYRLEVLDRIIRDFVEEGRVDDIGACNDQDGRAICGRLGRATRTNVAAGTGDILDEKLLSQPVGKSLRQKTAKHIGGAGWREWNNDAHWPGGVGLRSCDMS